MTITRSEKALHAQTSSVLEAQKLMIPLDDLANELSTEAAPYHTVMIIKKSTYIKKKNTKEVEEKKLPKERKKTNASPPEVLKTLSQPVLRKTQVPILPLNTISNNIKPIAEEPPTLPKKIEKEESIWDKIIEFQHGNDSIVIPANDENIRKLLEKKINRKTFRKFAETKVKDFNTRYKAEIGELTVGRILTDFPDMLEHFEQLDALSFSSDETKIFSDLREVDNKFKGFKKDILGLLSSKSKNASNYYLRHVESMRKLLRYYTPANSEYVFKLIGSIKYKDIIANSIYMLTSVARFVLKQHIDELKEDASRLEGTYKETEKLLRLLVKRDIILRAVDDKFKTTPDSQAIIFMIFRVWKSVFDITNAPLKDGQKHDSNIKSIKDIHQVKALEYTLNMFIALSKYMLEMKRKDSDFHYDIALSDAISNEFAILIANNLKSRSLTGAMFEVIGSSNANNANSSVNARTFKYKLDLIHKLINEEKGIGGNEQDDVLDYNEVEDDRFAENDERIKDSIESVIEELTIGRKFVVDTAFTKILKVEQDGNFTVDKEKGKKGHGHTDDREKKYIEDQELTATMNAISLAIASEAGIKVNKTELKYLLIAKTLVTLLASYLLNTMILKKWFSVPMQILINLHGIDYLSSYLQYFINMKEEQTKAEYNKYNAMDKAFNNTIELLFEQESIYPILDDGFAIEYILCEPTIKVYLSIIAAAFKDINLNEIAPQDISAMAKAMFNELCVYSINQGKKRIYNIKLEEENIKDIAEAFNDSIITHMEKKEGSHQYIPTSTPQEFSKKLKSLLDPYMSGRKVKKVALSTPESSPSHSLSSSTDEIPKPHKGDSSESASPTDSLSSSSEKKKPIEIPKPQDLNRARSIVKLRVKQPEHPIIELSSVAAVTLREKTDSPKVSPNASMTNKVTKKWVNSVVAKSESPRHANKNISPNVARSLDSGSPVKNIGDDSMGWQTASK